MNREEIVAIFGADTKNIDAAMRSMSSKFGNAAKSAAASFIAPWKSIGTALAGFITYGGLQAVAQGFKELIHQAESLGTSVEFIQGFSKAVKKLGADPEQAVKAFGKLADAVGSARSGSEEAAGKFDKWGVSLYDASGSALSTEAVLANVADRMKALADPALRASMAIDLFGKTGISMIPILNQGSEAIDKFASQARIAEEEMCNVVMMANDLKVMGNIAESVFAKSAWGAMQMAKALHTLFAGTEDERTKFMIGWEQISSLQKSFSGIPHIGMMNIGIAQALGDQPDKQTAKMEEELARRIQNKAASKEVLEGARQRYAMAGETAGNRYTILAQRGAEAVAARDQFEEGTPGWNAAETKRLGIAEKLKELDADAKKIADETLKKREQELSLSEQIAKAKERVAATEKKLRNADRDPEAAGLNPVDRASAERSLTDSRAELHALQEKEKDTKENADKQRERLEKEQKERNGLSLSDLMKFLQPRDEPETPSERVRGHRRRRGMRSGIVQNYVDPRGPFTDAELEEQGKVANIDQLNKWADENFQDGYYELGRQQRNDARSITDTLNFVKPSEQTPKDLIDGLEKMGLKKFLENADPSGIGISIIPRMGK